MARRFGGRARGQGRPWILKQVQDDGRGGVTLAALAALSLAVATPVLAASTMPSAPLANTQLPDPAQEAKAKALMETLRCLVCQGQSIADSNADLAADMRSLVRQRIQAGENPEAVRAWLIRRYGNWVSYKPELGADTAFLWLAPLILLAIGGVVALGSLKRRRR
jgi:cytochrome c-type biogenesis protein CcmH